MKFSFRKLASILTSAVMLGSTVGLAANFPAPFVQSGAADVAIVYGASAAASDLTAATSIQTSLSSSLASQTTTAATAVTGEGEKFSISRSSDKFNLGDSLSGIYSTLYKDQLPTLLADGTYTNYENSEYKYTQKVEIGNNINLTFFDDDDYKKDTPSTGIKLRSGEHVLNYTLDFTTDAESDIVTGDMDDIESTNLKVLGKTYYVLDAKNSTNIKLTLLDSATESTVEYGTPISMSVGSKTFTVSLEYIDSTYAKVKVNDETTTTLTQGGTYKLSDGTYVGVKKILFQNFAGGVQKADITLGTGKLVLESGSDVELNGKTITGITSYITKGTSSASKEKISMIALKWVTDDEMFVAPGKDLIMPGFEAIKFVYGGLTIPKEEITEVTYDGSNSFVLKAPIKDGTKSLNILFTNATGGFKGIGKDTSSYLVTSNTAHLRFNYTNNDKYFVVSWNSTRDASSYILSATITGDSSYNRTTVKNEITGTDVCKDLIKGATCNIGDATLTVDDIWKIGSDKWVNFTINAGGSYNKMYTTEGLAILLPFTATHGTGQGALNLSTGIAAGMNNASTSYYLNFFEEDKDGNLGKGRSFNITLGSTSTDFKATVSSVDSSAGVGTGYEVGETDIYESWVYNPAATSGNDVATKILYDTGGTQDTAKIVYHGSQVYADMLIAAPTVTSSTTGVSLGNVVVKDSEIASVSTKNLVVVGGSCINTVAAKMLGSEAPVCGDAFTAAASVSANQALIKIAASPYATTKIAMLVAGYEAEDTVKAATYITAEKPSTDSGKTVKLSTAAAAATVIA